jgi:hypothetical protein
LREVELVCRGWDDLSCQEDSTFNATKVHKISSNENAYSLLHVGAKLLCWSFSKHHRCMDKKS